MENGSLLRHQFPVLPHTLTGGHRGFDILHIAAALKTGAKTFLTFDDNQKQLAAAEGLHVPF